MLECGTSTEESSHYSPGTHTSGHDKAIRTRSRRIGYRDRRSPVSERSTSHPTKWKRKTWTTTANRLPQPEIHQHRAQLPNLQQRIPSHYQRAQELDTLVERH